VDEADPLRAVFFEVDGQVFQKVVEHPEIALTIYDLTGTQDPVQDVYRRISAIHSVPMPLDGPLFKFVLLRTRPDEL
jgi:hypothetical protein